MSNARAIPTAAVAAAVLAAATLLPWLAGCGEPERSAAPPAPPEMPGTPPPDLGDSVIVIPVELDLGAMAAQLEQDLPRVIAESSYGEEPRNVRYRVERDPVAVRMNGPELTLAIPLRFEAKARAGDAALLKGITAGCDAAATPSFTSRLEVSADWTLRSRTRAEPLQWDEPCRVLGIDLTDRIDEALAPKLEQAAARMDASIAEKVDLRDTVERAWRSLQEPIELAGGQRLALRPRRIAMGPIDGAAGRLRTELAVVARPRVTGRGATEPDRHAEPLAPADLAETEPAGPTSATHPAGPTSATHPAGPPDPRGPDADAVPTALPDNGELPTERGFHIVLEALLDYATAAVELQRAVGDRSFSTAGKTVRLAGVRVYGSGDRFVVQADVEGDAEARLYLLGRPRIDRERDELLIEDLDYSLATQDWILQAAEWLLGSRLRETLADGARFPLGERLEATRKSLEASLNAPRALDDPLTLRGTVDAVEVQGVYVTSAGFLAIAVADGDVSVKLE